jgi:hypothetical protein
MAVADLDRILVPGRADQAGLAAAMCDQRIEADRGAVDAQIGIRDDLQRDFAEVLGEISFMPSSIACVGSAGVEAPCTGASSAGSIGQHQIGERAASVDAEAIFC